MLISYSFPPNAVKSGSLSSLFLLPLKFLFLKVTSNFLIVKSVAYFSVPILLAL